MGKRNTRWPQTSLWAAASAAVAVPIGRAVLFESAGPAFLVQSQRSLVRPTAAGPRSRAAQLARDSRQTQLPGLSAPAAALAAGTALACVAASLRSRHSTRSSVSKQGRVALAALPWEDDDPYAKCSCLKIQVGLNFSKSLLATLNKLAEGGGEDLHGLLLDVVVALRRAQGSWCYGHGERLIFDSEAQGVREASAVMQRWGIEGETKWGDGEDWEKVDKTAIKGMTEYLVVTILVNCYGTLLPDEDKVRVRSITDLTKVLEAVSGIQEDELIALDVLWIPEEEGDTLSSMEVMSKFPEMAML
eukprot:CAMPEP_0170603428 /NCGR_PEP_ID=MMETSP0224-20130122/18907_1 /TAXON_ID=285029 /ORGANISM="Togula jolla, Strain CCCM 725" /LENGTH=302 /DNA_ID=CAMNT_0010928309 /DNA_START=16 /DNA_END=924 /DNA_ORIENTATION=+